MKMGSLTQRQLRVLISRGKGMSQRETAEELGTSRANVSMIEMRARKKILRARETLAAFESTLTDHSVEIEEGIRIFDIPPIVLRQGDKFGIHLQTNFIEIIRMVRRQRPSFLRNGETSRAIKFSFNQKGKLRLLES